MIASLKNHNLENLLNGSDINNIPNLNLTTTNPDLAVVNACNKSPVEVPSSSTTDDCIRICANGGATVMKVSEGDTIIWNSSKQLNSGSYCTIGPRPQCNMKTTVALMTLNGVICKSKFPEIVGGENGNKVIACNNSIIQDPQNVLWDFEKDEAYNPYKTLMTDPDETLSNGKYRFRCKFDGTDVRKNKYIAHPTNRFHPIRNYCASEIYEASPEVTTVFSKDGSYHCDCGDVRDTRVANRDKNDRTSLCVEGVVAYTTQCMVKERHKMIIPYRCFNNFSSIADVSKFPPCPPDQFLTKTSQYAHLEVIYSTNQNSLIEHPIYEQFQEDSGVYLANSDDELDGHLE